MIFVQLKNATSSAVKLSKHFRLSTLVEYQQNEAYMVSPDAALMATSGWKSRMAKGVKAVATAYAVLSNNSRSSTSQIIIGEVAFDSSASLVSGTFSVSIDSRLEHVATNGITAYGTYDVAAQLSAAASEFLEIWRDKGITVDIFENQ